MYQTTDFVLEYGPAIIEHVLLLQGFSNSTKLGKTFNIQEDIDKLMNAINEAENIFQLAKQSHEKVFIFGSKRLSY